MLESITLKGETLPLDGTTYVMGALNVSPESPNTDSIVRGTEQVVERGRRLMRDGAAFVDVGGRSSHFAADHVDTAEEIARIVPAITALTDAGIPTSIDTWDPRTMEAALEAGCDVINDADGFQDPEVIDLLRRTQAPVVVPFMNAVNPRHQEAVLDPDPLAPMLNWFEATTERLREAGVRKAILDPGIAFQRQGWTQEQKDAYQRTVIARLGELRAFGYPLLVPLPSRPSEAETVELARMVMAARPDFVRTYRPSLAKLAAP